MTLQAFGIDLLWLQRCCCPLSHLQVNVQLQLRCPADFTPHYGRHTCSELHRRILPSVHNKEDNMMEASSPLAAMQPPFMPRHHFGFCTEAPPSYASRAIKGFGQNSFNFKELSMKKPQTDYFSMEPIRGSSPTASLAADLSQNFHIDKR